MNSLQLIAKIEAKAREVVTAWMHWCKAEGWDCPEYDPFNEALNGLRELLRIEWKESADE